MTERFGKKIKKNNDGVWRATPEEWRRKIECEKKEGDRGLISAETWIREDENSLGFCVANSEENLIIGVSTAETINTRKTITSVEFKKKKQKN